MLIIILLKNNTCILVYSNSNLNPLDLKTIVVLHFYLDFMLLILDIIGIVLRSQYLFTFILKLDIFFAPILSYILDFPSGIISLLLEVY